MLATSSAIPDLKQTILDALGDRPALAGVDLLWDNDEDVGTAERDVIGFLDAHSTQVPVGVRQGGRNRRDEDISLRIAIRHVAAGKLGAGGGRESELAAWALVDELAAAVAESAAVRAAVRGTAGITDVLQQATYREGLWDQKLELELTCTQARIAP